MRTVLGKVPFIWTEVSSFCSDCAWPPQIFKNLSGFPTLPTTFFLPKIFQISRIFDQKSLQTQEISVLKMQVNKVLNKASLVKSNSRHGEV